MSRNYVGLIFFLSCRIPLAKGFSPNNRNSAAISHKTSASYKVFTDYRNSPPERITSAANILPATGCPPVKEISPTYRIPSEAGILTVTDFPQLHDFPQLKE
jgi:hypothetical protein